MFGNVNLNEFRYSTDRKGPWRLYIFEPDSEYHRGSQWFARKVQYADEEITIEQAKQRYRLAFDEGREIRITDGGDQLVHHVKDGRVLYGETFWDDITEVR